MQLKDTMLVANGAFVVNPDQFQFFVGENGQIESVTLNDCSLAVLNLQLGVSKLIDSLAIREFVLSVPGKTKLGKQLQLGKLYSLASTVDKIIIIIDNWCVERNYP